jgi:lysyl-tRNA synthetase class 1
MDNCLMTDRKIKTVPMSLLVQLGSIVDFNIPMLETVFEKIDQPYKYEDFSDRLDRARFWLETCSPENANKLRQTRDWDLYESLDEKEKEEISLLHTYLSGEGYTLDDLNTELYDIPKKIFGTDIPELKKIQGKFFKNVYTLLLGKEKGPRLYLFLFAIDKERYLHLLDFSTPKTEEELHPVVEEEVPEEAEIVYGDPDPVEPVKEEIDIDFFSKMDLRVCKVLKCQEIRKSHSCYKITLFDGLKERVIVSSIKQYYQPEDLIGKKIIVVANLAPTRITGVKSEGMLLAGTNNACGCRVIFVDDAIPEGTAIR